MNTQMLDFAVPYLDNLGQMLHFSLFENKIISLNELYSSF